MKKYLSPLLIKLRCKIYLNAQSLYEGLVNELQKIADYLNFMRSCYLSTFVVVLIIHFFNSNLYSAQIPYILFSGTSHPALAEEIAHHLGIRLGTAQIQLFPDHEISVQILDNVRGRDVFVLQSLAHNPNDYLMELLILVDALKRASAHNIIALIPYYAYARQDWKDKGRTPITAKLVASLLEKAGVTRVITMDLHSEQIQGFFDIPLDNLSAKKLFIKKIKNLGLENLILCAPDVGAAKRTRAIANELNVDIAIVDKQRIDSEGVKAHTIIGNVQGKHVVLIDDICSTGGTLKCAAKTCKDAGALNIFAAITHLVLNKNLTQESESMIDHLLITNTIPLSKEIDGSNIEILSVAEIFAKAIEGVVENTSISAIFNGS